MEEDVFERGEQQESADGLEETALTVEIFTIDGPMGNHRLDFVVSRLFGLSRGYAKKLVYSGQVARVGEGNEKNRYRRVKPSLIVETGEAFEILIPAPETLELEPEPVDFDIVYCDEDLIVIDKPAGLVVHPAPGHWHGTLVHGLLYKFPEMGNLNGVNRPGIVHRLDATTSGLMVVARNGLAQEGLFKDFKSRRVGKEYIALAHGVPRAEAGTIDMPIGRDPNHRQRMAVVEWGREARTDYKVLARYRTPDGETCSLVLCTLHSGRTHQIRVHMKAIGCPLVGDVVYAPSKRSPFDGPRVFLHAWRLSFVHPRTRETMTFTSRLHGDLISLLQFCTAFTEHAK